METQDEKEGLPYYLWSDGSRIFIGFAVHGRYIAPDNVTVLLTQNGKSFKDVTGHWAEDYIGFVAEREIFLGTDSNTFSPDTGMSRAMFTAVIGRLYERSYGKIEPLSPHTFIDCDYDAYYSRYVDWAAENGIICGYGNESFGPDDQITHEQMAAILYRFADFTGFLPDSMDTGMNYPDADRISGYAKNAALYCQTTGIIGGREGGMFAPQEKASRAETAAIIQRFIEFIFTSCL
ncbi:MAG: S-layer homology domain-containing protein [Clostridiaceae bacterium]|nr:S-layer homology domain-containing protein [Clostridiaceae bacterium]